MADVSNIIYLIITLLVLGGSVAAILFIINRFSEFTSTTKEKLKSRGYELSDQGMSVQTKKRLDREDYMDATQRGFIKALESSSFGARGGQQKEATSVFQDRKTRKARSGQKGQT